MTRRTRPRCPDVSDQTQRVLASRDAADEPRGAVRLSSPVALVGNAGVDAVEDALRRLRTCVDMRPRTSRRSRSRRGHRRESPPSTLELVDPPRFMLLLHVLARAPSAPLAPRRARPGLAADGDRGPARPPLRACAAVAAGRAGGCPGRTRDYPWRPKLQCRGRPDRPFARRVGVVGQPTSMWAGRRADGLRGSARPALRPRRGCTRRRRPACVETFRRRTTPGLGRCSPARPQLEPQRDERPPTPAR